MFLISYVLFLLGFAFFTIHESIAFKGSFSRFGKWFEMKNPIDMKKKFPLFPFVWDAYHCSGWLMLFSFFSSMFFASLDKINNPFVGYWIIGGTLAGIALIINLMLYGIYPEEK